MQIPYLEFIEISGLANVFNFSKEVETFANDQSLSYNNKFEILIKPLTPNEISEILKICNRDKLAVTVRGGGTGVTGGAIPVVGGVVLSLERMNKVLHINKTEAFVIAEAGVVTKELYDIIEENDFFFPVRPTSESFSFVGGNVAENAGSINSCKYGKISTYVLNLEIVTPMGEIFWTGANVTKSSTGLNLTHLFVGSEGILGVITKVVYRLLPKVDLLYEASILIDFNNLENACDFLVFLKKSKISVLNAELIGYSALQITSTYLDEPLDHYSLGAVEQIVITLQEQNNLLLEKTINTVKSLADQFYKSKISIGLNLNERKLLWKVRLNIGNALAARKGKYRDIDACVPLEFLYKYIIKVQHICAMYEIDLVYFGHGMDGNLHAMILEKEDVSISQTDQFESAALEIYSYVIENGGVISGEHGIGSVQRKFMKLQFTAEHLLLMQKIKKVFDPNNIMNPEKVL